MSRVDQFLSLNSSKPPIWSRNSYIPRMAWVEEAAILSCLESPGLALSAQKPTASSLRDRGSRRNLSETVIWPANPAKGEGGQEHSCQPSERTFITTHNSDTDGKTLRCTGQFWSEYGNEGHEWNCWNLSVCDRHKQPMLADEQLRKKPIPVKRLNCLKWLSERPFSILTDH